MTVDRWDTAHTWRAYHLLTCGWFATAAALVTLNWYRRDVAWAANTVGALVLALAVRGCLYDPHPWAPWWSVGAAAGVALLATVSGLRQRRQTLAYAAVLLAVMAMTLYWLWVGRQVRPDFQFVLNLLFSDLAIATWGAAFWLA